MTEQSQRRARYYAKAVWIVGASSGIGQELALQLLRQGAFVVLSSRNKDALMTIAHSYPNQTCVLPVDLESINDAWIEQAMNMIKHRFNRLDYLFLNACMSHDYTAYELSTIMTDRRIFEVNFFGLVQIAKHVAKLFVQQGRGHLVVTSSVMGKFGYPRRSSYCASKHALQGYFNALRTELALESSDIHTTLLVLGAIDTSIGFNAVDHRGDALNKKGDFQKHGSPVTTTVSRILIAVYKRKTEVIIGKQGRVSVWLNRWFPSFFYKLVCRNSTTQYKENTHVRSS